MEWQHNHILVHRDDTFLQQPGAITIYNDPMYVSGWNPFTKNPLMTCHPHKMTAEKYNIVGTQAMKSMNSGKCCKISWDFDVHLGWHHQSIRASQNHQKLAKTLKKTSHFSLSTVPDDGLAPLGARPSAGAVMTKFYIYIYGTSTQRFDMTKNIILTSNICLYIMWFNLAECMVDFKGIYIYKDFYCWSRQKHPKVNWKVCNAICNKNRS